MEISELYQGMLGIFAKYLGLAENGELAGILQDNAGVCRKATDYFEHKEEQTACDTRGMLKEMSRIEAVNVVYVLKNIGTEENELFSRALREANSLKEKFLLSSREAGKERGLADLSLEEILERINSFNAGLANHISQSMNSRHNMLHTKAMICYAESDELSDEARRRGLIQTLAELSLVYRENRDKLNDTDRKVVEDKLKCAGEDVNSGRYWEAISDVACLEEHFLQECLQSLPFTEGELSRDARTFTSRRIARCLGGNIVKDEAD